MTINFDGGVKHSSSKFFSAASLNKSAPQIVIHARVQAMKPYILVIWITSRLVWIAPT